MEQFSIENLTTKTNIKYASANSFLPASYNHLMLMMLIVLVSDLFFAFEHLRH